MSTWAGRSPIAPGRKLERGGSGGQAPAPVVVQAVAAVRERHKRRCGPQLRQRLKRTAHGPVAGRQPVLLAPQHQQRALQRWQDVQRGGAALRACRCEMAACLVRHMPHSLCRCRSMGLPSRRPKSAFGGHLCTRR